MIIKLIKKCDISKTVLPQVAVGNYWIKDQKNRNLINIEGKKGKWVIESNNYVKIISSQSSFESTNNTEFKHVENNIMKETVLEENHMYYLLVGANRELYILCCLPTYDMNFEQYNINAKEMTIGSSLNNDIQYSNNLIANQHAYIYYSNGRWIIENFDKDFGTFVNNIPVYKTSRVLLNGDIIFIMGLKIIVMGQSIYINNPSNQVRINKQVFEKSENIDIPFTYIEEDEDLVIEEEQEYYSRAPRLTNKIEKEKVKIDPPPAAQNKDDMSSVFLILSTMTMGIIMVMSMANTISGITSGEASTGRIIISILMTILMVISTIIVPVFQVKYQKKQQKKYEEKRQRKYRDYINSKADKIDEIMEEQRNIYNKNYVSTEECAQIILSKSPRLWERKIEDDDFLMLRLGIGNIPLEIDIQYPENQFTLEEDNLVDILNTVANKSKILENVPIVLSLTEKNIVGIISKEEEERRNYLKDLIMQIITFHSYEELKLVFLIKKDKNKRWYHLAMLPHIWNNRKNVRFFSDDYDEMQEISNYLEDVFKERITANDLSYNQVSPYYLIITDDYKTIEKLKIVQEIMETKQNVGFSILCASENIMNLPNECKAFVDIDNGEGTVYESGVSSKKQIKFKYNNKQRLFFPKIVETISNIQTNYYETKEVFLPNTYTFLEMYDVGRIEQLNILERWGKNDSTLSLKSPIGIDSQGTIIALDVHEKFHGPHGLIAGSTGSGKSELIITYILSLAVNYHPNDVAFILIDYKGGGLAGAFKKREVKLPHLVGTITNIDTAGLQRSLVSIQSELKRRQIMFNEARNMTDEGTIDIYKYQKLYHEGVLKEPIPHLLIICDEFAELKQQQEEFMDELISVARIGRSLGVHLILATQKPAGIVNQQIRSNSKFSICLKVQSREDSVDVINIPDAANLKNIGQFYMQVGNGEFFTLGQSAWTGALYYPSDVRQQKPDKAVEVISNIGTTIKRVDSSKEKSISAEGEQLTNIVKYLYQIAKEEGIEDKQLWIENIPENIFVDELRKKYKIKHVKNYIEPIAGEYDDPYHQSQGVYTLNLSEEGNVIIYGSADSGKETLLSTIVYDLMTTYSTEEVEIYIMDFGSEALKIFLKSPHVGDIVFLGDDEKINRFFDMIQKEVKERKEILSDYNGDYNLYVKSGGKAMPMTVIIINNYEAFSETYDDKYEDVLLTMTREAVNCGIIFIMTASAFNNVRYRLTQNFKQKIALQLNNSDDYFNIFDNIGKIRPSRIFGRGLISIGAGNVYEFQTAKICEQERWNTYIKAKIEELQKIEMKIARRIPILPETISIKDVEAEINGLNSIPLGISKNDLKIYTYDFTKYLVNIITSKNIEDALQFMGHLLEELNQSENIEITLLDFEKVFLNNTSNVENYNNLIKNINENTNNLCIIIRNR